MSPNSCQIDKTILVWGEAEQAAAFLSKCHDRQPVLWAHFDDYSTAMHDGIFDIQAERLDWITGSNGDFIVRIVTKLGIEECHVGCIVVFPGYQADTGEARLITSFKDNSTLLFDAASLGQTQFSRVLQKALELAGEGNQIYVVADEIQIASPGGEQLYQDARDAGVVFFKDSKCICNNNDSKYKVEIMSNSLGNIDTYIIDVDEVIRIKPLLCSDNYMELLKQLQVSEIKLQESYPFLTNRRGIFVVADQDYEDHLFYHLQNYADGEIMVPKGRFEVVSELCAMCLTCYRVCPHNAVIMGQPAANMYGQAMFIDSKSCEACGICYAECPARAINTQGQARPVKAAILACENSGRPIMKNQDFIYYLFPCAGSISINDVLAAFEDGNERVLLLACHEGKCQHEYGGRRLQSRVKRLNRLLDQVKPGYKIELVRISAVDRPDDVLRRVGKTK